MTDKQWNEKTKTDTINAKDALVKIGYIKTTWGWILESRLTHLKSQGMISIKDKKLGYTHKGSNYGVHEINAYLSGAADSI